jgi:hypothetical protein
MRPIKVIFSVIIFLLSSQLYAQKGTIRGTIFDDTLGEALMGVTVVAEGTTAGAITDLDGKFNLTLPAGTYNLKLSFVSFETLSVKDVKVTEGGVTVLDDLKLKTATLGLGEVTITANAVRNTENSIMTIKMKSPNVLDGISAAGFRKMGDSDAASSMKRVPGVSVEGGKYVYVRGLGDRYTKTIINGVDMPGLDPDRNSIQMDIFPTSVIDNIIVHKSFSAELPADFTGGVVDIGIKDFPEQRKGNVFISGAYNPDYHFRDNYLTYEGGKTDFLGFDDGTRKIPATDNIPFYSEVVGLPATDEKSVRYREILEGFNPTMAAIKQKSFMDYSFGASMGNQFPLKKVTIGYNFGLSYKNTTEFYKDAEYGRYGLSPDADITEMEVREFQKGDFGISSVLISGLGGFAVKTRKSKYRLNLLHLQNGESKAGIFDYQSSDLGTIFEGIQHNLEFSQRSVTNILLDGKHSFTDSKWDIVWKISPTFSVINDPDVRFTRYVRQGGNFVIGTESGFPERIWRELSEMNIGSILHLTKEYNFRGQMAKLHFGGAYTYKERDFFINKYALNIRNIPVTGDPDELFREENLWPYQGNDIYSGTTYEANFVPNNPNKFNARSGNAAGYISTELSLFKNLRAILGVRAENYTQRYTGQDQLGTNVLNDDVVLDNLDFFPTANFIYSISEKQNFRFSYAKTIARPSFKEMSYAEISDPISNRTFIGGMFRDADDVAGLVYWDGNLVNTYIQNLDVRWELYHSNGQMISLSGFYKMFDNPIEIVQYATTQKSSLQPRNVGDGQVIGIETEFRQNLDLISNSLKNFFVNGNISITKSRIDMSVTEYFSRVENARTGQTIEETREMAGQAPYIINAGLSYNGGENGFWKGLEAGVYYNVQGTTLQYVGIADKPDIYMLPFHSLNFNASKYLGKDNRTQLGFKIENLLNDRKESVFRSFNPTDQFFTKLEPGITFQLKLSYSLFK